MELKNLQAIVLMLVLIGMIIGVGVLVIDKFGTATRDEVTISETVATTDTGTLAHTPLVSVERFGNSSKYNTTFNCAGCAVNYTLSTGALVVDNSTFANGNWIANYTYYKNSTATDSMTDMRAAIAPIASTWLSLIVTIIVLSIILGLVINSFAGKR